MFAGYYFGVFVFLTPLLSRLEEALQTDRRTVKQLFWTVVLVVCLAAFPSMTETFYLGGMRRPGDGGDLRCDTDELSGRSGCAWCRHCYRRHC